MDETEHTPLDRPDITGPLPGYRLRAQLARTGMSEVFRAEEADSGRPVALKVIGPELMRLPGFAERFERESRVAVTLKHPNIVDVYRAGKADGGRLGFLAMRFIEGSNLRLVLENHGKLGLEATVDIAQQVAAALDAAHARNVIHRDVKPANILIEEATGRAYLCDFGIAKDIELSSITTTGATVGSLLYLSPEQQRSGRDVDRRTDVYALGCVLYDCLAGVPATPVRDRRVLSVPLLGSPVDRVLRKAMAEDPAHRHGSCGELAEELAAAAAKTPSVRRWAGAMAVAGAGLTTALVATVAATVVDPAPDRAALARVPAALRDDCEAEVEPMTGANSALSCRDAVLNLFPDTRSANEAYSRLVGEAGVATGQGDCADWTGAEHRYPATGPMRGRVLCHVRDGSAVLVWTDEQARTVTRADAPAAEGAALLQAWSAWTGGDPAFPTAQERELFDLTAGTDCKRLSNLDSAAIAGVTCTPTGSGAREVSYLRFASLPELRASFTGRVGEAKAPSGVSCAGPDFLGTGRHDWLSVDLGQYLCRPGPDGTLAMEWSMEPLLIAGRVTGSERGALHGWWWEWHLAPLSRIVAAVNARAAPPFPTGPERALLDRIPIASRLNCLRPSPGQVWADIGGVTPVAAVACGRTSGAGLVVYYQFADAEAMRRTFNAGSDTEPEKDCTRLPEEFYGSRPYSRGNGSSGTLRCGTHDSTGERYLQWTDERFAIAVYAHWGTEPFAIIDWWRHDAGPA